MQEPDLDDSRLVEVVTWTLYLGWLTGMAAIALFLGVEPLPAVQAQVAGAWGTVLALTVGVAFILVARAVYDALRRSWRGTPPASTAPAEPPTEPVKQRPGRKPHDKRKRGY